MRNSVADICCTIAGIAVFIEPIPILIPIPPDEPFTAWFIGCQRTDEEIIYFRSCIKALIPLLSFYRPVTTDRGIGTIIQRLPDCQIVLLNRYAIIFYPGENIFNSITSREWQTTKEIEDLPKAAATALADFLQCLKETRLIDEGGFTRLNGTKINFEPHTTLALNSKGPLTYIF